MSQRRSPDLVEIQNAIDGEIAEYPAAYRFVVEQVVKEGVVWKVFIRLKDGQRHGLDEAFEGSRAWWPGNPPGSGDVLSVIPEDHQINIRFAPSPPIEGEPILLYPPRYLDALKTQWDDEASANRALQWLESAIERNVFTADEVTNPPGGDRLRERQREAFQLTGWNVGYLWGPPGTGKTYTLGALLGQYLLQRPAARVLLMSTTNTAVDQALIAVDRALERRSAREPRCASIRKDCLRLGNHFVAGNYSDRQHLLPVKDERLLKQLTALEAAKPDVVDVGAYARWKSEVERVRAAMRAISTETLECARLSALTTTRALFTIDDLRRLAPYDLIVFDEASQVPVAIAAQVATLGTRVLFAGDPNQLAPIVRSERDDCERWLGQSMFRHRDATPSAVCRLNEQSRMAADICRIVAGVFYTGDLKVAGDCVADGAWISNRAVPVVAPVRDSRTWIQPVASKGRWHPFYGGIVREESAEFIADFVEHSVALQPIEEILVLTPFRAQRALIRAHLRKRDLQKVAVSTVHRAQGSERHTVIFDPVDGTNPFLLTDDAKRLVNVGISRAKARLVVTLSPSDCDNGILKQIADLVGFGFPSMSRIDAVPISLALRSPGFPKSFVGRVVRIGAVVGRVESESGDNLVLTDTETGRARRFKLSVLRGRSSEPSEELQKTGEHDLEHKRSKVLRAPAAAVPPPGPTGGGGSASSRVPPPVTRSVMRALVNSPLIRRIRREKTETTSVEPANVPTNVVAGEVTNVSDGFGYIRGDDGRSYQYRYKSLAPRLKMNGVVEGLRVYFEPGPVVGGVATVISVTPLE